MRLLLFAARLSWHGSGLAHCCLAHCRLAHCCRLREPRLSADFDAYSVEFGRNGLSDTFDISLRDLADYYFVPLKACIDIADVGAFMCSYNAINGTAGVSSVY